MTDAQSGTHESLRLTDKLRLSDEEIVAAALDYWGARFADDYLRDLVPEGKRALELAAQLRREGGLQV